MRKFLISYVSHNEDGSGSTFGNFLAVMQCGSGYLPKADEVMKQVKEGCSNLVSGRVLVLGVSEVDTGTENSHIAFHNKK